MSTKLAEIVKRGGIARGKSVTLGLDVGNATVVATNGEQTIVLPSVYTFMGDMSAARGNPAGIIVGTDSRSYIVGEAAFDQPGETSLLGTDERYGAVICRLFLYAAIGRLYPHDDCEPLVLHVALGTGTPISLHDANKDAITRLYCGDHRFSVNGAAYLVHITNVHIGSEARLVGILLPEAARIGRTAIIDGGGKTTNVALFSSGIYKNGGTYPYGFTKALADFPFRLDNQAAFELQRAVATKKPFFVTSGGKRERIDQTFRSHVEGYAGDVLDALSAKVPIASADSVFFIGGQSYFVSALLRERGIKVATFEGIAPEAVNATAYYQEASNR
jgi:hypothetical protein